MRTVRRRAGVMRNAPSVYRIRRANAVAFVHLAVCNPSARYGRERAADFSLARRLIVLLRKRVRRTCGEARRCAVVACRMSHVACRLSLVACRLSLVACRLSLVAQRRTDRNDSTTCAISSIACDMRITDAISTRVPVRCRSTGEHALRDIDAM
ncbi:hypothetical protein WS71_10650 [Burkholderia mayonis]|uniref:Uncharacterized protein n=1 Tax=Burkholderia mayonis TaxID=1385591 RepID=A0A1B4FVN2_9BURK|nr:hypothetical protein WS71_10650 [Burkholderia mayonis]KVE58878.1 hypothetical protein WS71_23685 [Burkholderia mayonis]